MNHYILKREIGRGSFGVVHLGVDSTTGEEFVLCPRFLGREESLITGDQRVFQVEATETISVDDFTKDTYPWIGESKSQFNGGTTIRHETSFRVRHSP